MPPPTPVPRVNCNVNVSIDCMTQGGRDCAAIKPPNQICSDGTPLENITFGYTGSSCQSIDNQQANKTYCIDFAPIPNEVVNILCKNPSNGMALGVEPSKVQPGSVFIVYPLLCGSLPEKIDCIILDNNNTKLQQLIIDTSGNVPLKLKNNFGAFTLESCVTQRGEKSCLETLRYDINVDNIGTVAMTITVLDFIFNKMTVNLLGEVGLNPVPPGQSTALQPMLKVDICAGEEYSAKVNVEATPPNGEKCQATDQYAFTIPKPQVDCSLGVNFNCSTQDGGDCTAIKPPTCSDGTPVESLTINFTGSVCMPNSNKQGNESRCVDSAPFMNDNATVLCKDISNGFDVMVQPSNVQPGDTFQVIAGLCGSLPAKIDCIIFDKTGTKIQETVIDTSGTVPLNLNDRFGGFTVQTCVTQRGEKSCLHTLNYDITVANVGSVEMDVTVVDFLFEKSTTSLLGNLQLNPIPTGKSTLLNPKRDINICTNESFFAQVSVAANSPSGGMCQATAQYAFMVTLPPPPAPRAAPALSPMTNIPAVPFALAPQVPPDLPPTNLPINIMPTRRPSSLAPSANALMTACQLKADTICETLQPGNLTGRCEDIKNPNNVTCSNGSIPTSVSFAYQAKGGATNITVKVTVHGAEMSIFVRDGGIFTVGGNLTNGLTLSIDGIGSKTIDTSCSVGNDLTLGNQFGPLELIGFQNKDGDFTSVYIVRVSYLVQNVGPNDADVDSVIITSELSNGGASFNALSSTQDIHRGATQLIFNETQLVDALQKFSQNHTFIFRSDVTGKSRIGGLPCQANATYSF